jgi:hypothetical protein
MVETQVYPTFLVLKKYAYEITVLSVRLRVPFPSHELLNA